jgi:hypothetical protein
MMRAPGALGGYGATAGGMSGGGSMIPYAGNFGGFMPYRVGGGANLTLATRGTSMIGSSRMSFSLSPMSGGMSSRVGGKMSQGFGGMRPRTIGGGNMNVMPPSFGYPFYQPPSLVEPLSSGAGMPSM